MNEALLDGINSRAQPRDHLVIVGDVMLGKFEENVRLLSKIRAGRISILPGNHDRWSLAYGHRGSVEVKTSKRRIWKAQYEAARGGIVCFEDRVPSVWRWQVGGVGVLMSHYPYVGADSGERTGTAGCGPWTAGCRWSAGTCMGAGRCGTGCSTSGWTSTGSCR